MRENRSSGSEGGEPQLNAACLPLSLTFVGCVSNGSARLWPSLALVRQAPLPLGITIVADRLKNPARPSLSLWDVPNSCVSCQ